VAAPSLCRQTWWCLRMVLAPAAAPSCSKRCALSCLLRHALLQHEVRTGCGRKALHAWYADAFPRPDACMACARASESGCVRRPVCSVARLMHACALPSVLRGALPEP
jgi:hypothetical protein